MDRNKTNTEVDFEHPLSVPKTQTKQLGIEKNQNKQTPNYDFIRIKSNLNRNLGKSNEEEKKQDKKGTVPPENNSKNLCCQKCNSDDEIITFPCKHSFCSICICNQLEITLEEKKLKLIECRICNAKIPLNLIKSILSEESLVFYLERLSTEIIGYDSFASYEKFQKNCRKCSEHHTSSETCIEFYNRTKPKILCDNNKCAKEINVSLNCGHNYCNFCILALIKENLNKDPFSLIRCGLCHSIIPDSILHSAFYGKKYFVEYQQQVIDNTILCPKFSCQICLAEITVSEGITLSCDHRFCKSCISGYLTEKIKNFEVTEKDLVCPQCDKPIAGEYMETGNSNQEVIGNYELIKACVSEELFEKYVHVTIKAYKSEEDDLIMKWCFNCEFGCLIHINDKEFFCPNCNAKYCPRCNQKHLIRGACNNQDFYLDKLMKDMSKCPNCNELVSKVSGCNFLQCCWPTCKDVNFCAICWKRLKVIYMQKEQHFSHYRRTGPFGITCNTTDRLKDD